MHYRSDLILKRRFKPVCIAALLFLTSPPSYAYGGYHYGYHHGYYGGHVSYGYHGHDDTAGYVVLGILGALLLGHIFSQDDDYRYPRRTSEPVVYTPPPAPVVVPARQRVPQYNYAADEGWNKLISGDAGHALDIFAVQSQQNLESGIPRIGFALAAAAIGERERAVRAMRKAVTTDPEALNLVQNDEELMTTIDFLNDVYKEELTVNPANSDNTFMVAALSYIREDYSTANNLLSDNDQSFSAIKLKELLARHY